MGANNEGVGVWTIRFEKGVQMTDEYGTGLNFEDNQPAVGILSKK